MITGKKFYDTWFPLFLTYGFGYGKFFRAEHWATAEGENCAYGPTLEEGRNLFLTMKLVVLYSQIAILGEEKKSVGKKTHKNYIFDE